MAAAQQEGTGPSSTLGCYLTYGVITQYSKAKGWAKARPDRIAELKFEISNPKP